MQTVPYTGDETNELTADRTEQTNDRVVASALLFLSGEGEERAKGVLLWASASYTQTPRSSGTFYSYSLLPSNGLAPGLAALI